MGILFDLMLIIIKIHLCLSILAKNAQLTLTCSRLWLAEKNTSLCENKKHGDSWLNSWQYFGNYHCSEQYCHKSSTFGNLHSLVSICFIVISSFGQSFLKMSSPDYDQFAEDHQCLLIVIKSIGKCTILI